MNLKIKGYVRLTISGQPANDEAGTPEIPDTQVQMSLQNIVYFGPFPEPTVNQAIVHTTVGNYLTVHTPDELEELIAKAIADDNSYRIP